jgi:hypothetical protein
MDVEPPKGGPCLIHLVRAANGPEPPRAFASALRTHPPGVDCELVLALKGFKSPEAARPYVEELAFLEPNTLFFSDAGLDLDVYLAAADRLRRSRYCFLNSYSLPRVDDWLGKLDRALAQPGAGLVGATGSWTSTRSWIAYSLRLPSAYRGHLPPPRDVRRQLLALIPEQAARGRRTALESLGARASTLRLLAAQESFPAHHLRTNAFMISHSTLRRLHVHSSAGKLDTLKLENSRRGITRQVQSLGLRTLVVDSEGEVFDHDRWDRSRTFCQEDQEGLLVADNRTLMYERGDRALRRTLSVLNWGPSAQPGI